MVDRDKTHATAAAYDDAAQDFADRTAQHSELAAAFFERFHTGLPPNSLIADVGCGPGHDLGRLQAAGHRAVGVDISRGLLGLCARGAPVCGDIGRLPIANRVLDAIWCSAALLHVGRDDLASTLSEWDRALRPSATIGLVTSLGGDEGWELVPASKNRTPEINHGNQRWFVHHHQADVLAAVAAARWHVTWSAVRPGTRDWLQIIAEKP